MRFIRVSNTETKKKILQLRGCIIDFLYQVFQQSYSVTSRSDFYESFGNENALAALYDSSLPHTKKRILDFSRDFTSAFNAVLHDFYFNRDYARFVLDYKLPYYVAGGLGKEIFEELDALYTVMSCLRILPNLHLDSINTDEESEFMSNLSFGDDEGF